MCSVTVVIFQASSELKMVNERSGCKLLLVASISSFVPNGMKKEVWLKYGALEFL